MTFPNNVDPGYVHTKGEDSYTFCAHNQWHRTVISVAPKVVQYSNLLPDKWEELQNSDDTEEAE
jgi:hypothetical protein